MTMRKFKSGLFGYSKKSVEKLVSSITSRYEQRKSELDALIGELSSGQVKPVRSIPATDEPERTRLVLRPRASLWGYRKGAVNQYIRNLNKYCDQELSELRRKAEALQQTAAEKMGESELEVAASVTEAAMVVPEVVEERSPTEGLSPVEAQSSVEVQFPVESLSSADDRAIAEDLPVAGMPVVEELRVEPLSAAQPQAEQSPSPEAPLGATPALPAANARRSGNVVQFRRKSPSPEEAAELQLSQLSQLSLPSPQSQQSLELMEHSVGYWGEIQRYLATPSAGLEAAETIASEPILGAAPLASVSSMNEAVPAFFDYHLPETVIRHSASGRSPQRQPNSPTPLKAPAKDKSKTEEAEQQSQTAPTAPTIPTVSALSAAPTAPQPTAVSSRGITEEVAQLRYKYILGKITGKDLLTRQGRLIAAKNTPITRAIVDEADREGLLAELIIHMTIPGIEVDEP